MLMMKFSAAVLVMAMIFGGAATAVQAAQGSLPGQPMYPLKIMVEDVQGTVAGPSERVEQSMARMENRIQEILRLREAGQEIPEAAFTRLQNQLEQTLRLMLKLAGEPFNQELMQVRSRLLAQEQVLRELQNQQPGNEEAVLERLRTMLQERLQLLGDESQSMEQIREQIRLREANPEGPATSPGNEGGTGAGPGIPEPGESGPGPGAGAGGPAGTNTPVQDGTGPGPGPGPEVTPTPGGGSGPGPGAGEPAATCTPVQDGTGPGPGPGPEATPTPGGGSGPGPGAGEPSATCTPVQDGTGPGPGPGAGATPTPGGSGSTGKP